MFGKPSLITRITIGKAIGFVLGLIGFLVLPIIIPDIDLAFRLGVLFWYSTVGAIIGVFGVFSYHPILHLPLPWWWRSSIIGGWMNLLLVLFTFDKLSLMMEGVFGQGALFSSPYWVIVEGLFVGLFIGYFATRFGGEGVEAAGK